MDHIILDHFREGLPVVSSVHTSLRVLLSRLIVDERSVGCFFESAVLGVDVGRLHRRHPGVEDALIHYIGKERNQSEESEIIGFEAPNYTI